jgi:hypothetical protein
VENESTNVTVLSNSHNSNETDKPFFTTIFQESSFCSQYEAPTWDAIIILYVQDSSSNVRQVEVLI